MSGPSLPNKDVLALAILRGEIMHIITNWHIHHHEVVGINAYSAGLNALERKLNKHRSYVLELKTTNAKQRCGRWKQAHSCPPREGNPLSQGPSMEDRRPLSDWRACPLPSGGFAPSGVGDVPCFCHNELLLGSTLSMAQHREYAIDSVCVSDDVVGIWTPSHNNFKRNLFLWLALW